MANNRKKTVLLPIILLILVALCIYGASYLYALFVDMGIAQKTRNWGAFRLPEPVKIGIFSIFSADKKAHPDAFKWACLIAGGIFFISFLGLASLFNSKKSLYGDARFANIGEVKQANLLIPFKQAQKAGLFAGDAIIVGKMGNNYVGLRGQQFVYLAAPTRSGKGTGVVNPVGLSYAHSMVVLDIKRELWEITAAYRQKHGHRVYLFNPFDAEGRTAKWNPCSYIRRDYKLREKDIKNIAISLIPSKASDPYWENAARAFFTGLMLYCLDKENDDPNFKTTIKAVYDLATCVENNVSEYFTVKANELFVSDQARQRINAAVTMGEKPFTSILGTMNTALEPFAGELVSKAMSGDDFDLRKVRQQKMSIYLGIDSGDLEQAAPLINLFYTQLIDENTRVRPQNDKSLQYQCLLLMDEGTAPGRIEKLTTAVSYMAGFNLRMLLIVQSPAQLRENKLYGVEGTKNILSNCALKVMYTPNDYDDADEYSKLLGTKTVKERTSKTMGKGRTDTTQTQNSRALMLAQELLAMPETEIIIRYDQVAYPISAKKNCYYKDKHFLHFKKLGKLKPKATIFTDDNKHSGNLKANNSNQPQQRHYDELKRQHPQEFSRMYYGKLRHIFVQHAEQALCETLYN